MTRAFRALQSGLVLLTLVLFVSVASAAPKQKIAILGIEAVVGANNQIDPADTRFAKELTTELRSRANNSKLFELTKDQRELVDEKLMNNCGAEHPQCMAPIGASMGADVLLFGKVANLKGGGYKVTLTLVSVGKRQIIASDPNAIIAVGDTKNPGLANWVREHYRKITGEGGEGTLIITAPGATAGRVLVEGETKDSLKSGTATITLPEGRYRVGVEADGFKLWEQEGVTISADRPTELKPTLVRAKVDDVRSDENGKVEEGTLLRREGTLSSKKGNKTLFKVVAAVGLGGAAVGGVIWGYEYFGPISSFDGAKVSNFDYAEGSKKFTNIDESRCGNDGKFTEKNGTDSPGSRSATDKFEKACTGYKVTKVVAPTTIALGLIGGAALIYVLVSNSDNQERQLAGRQKKRRNLMVTPVITPDGTGATVRFDW